MAYNANIPQPGDQLSQSQADLLNNFSAIKTLIDVNHVDFGAAGQGKHKWVSMPEQGSAPGTAADEGALYTKAVSGVTQLFFQNESAGSEVQMTGPSSITANGYITLPNGLIVQWGKTTTASGSGTITYPIAFPTAVFNVMVCSGNFPAVGNFGVDVDVDSTTMTTTTAHVFAAINGVVANTAVFYIAIGH